MAELKDSVSNPKDLLGISALCHHSPFTMHDASAK